MFLKARVKTPLDIPYKIYSRTFVIIPIQLQVLILETLIISIFVRLNCRMLAKINQTQSIKIKNNR